MATANPWPLRRKQPHHQETACEAGGVFQRHLAGPSFQAPRNILPFICLKFHTEPFIALCGTHENEEVNYYIYIYFSMKELLDCFLRTSFDAEKGWKCITSQGTKGTVKSTWPKFSSRQCLCLEICIQEVCKGLLWGAKAVKDERGRTEQT